MRDFMNYETRVTAMVVAPKGEPIYSEQATTVQIDDEAAGEFVVVSQEGGRAPEKGKISINPEEWPALRKAIDRLVKECRDA